MPDVQFLRRGNIAAHGAQGMESGHPDLAVEVISEHSRGYDRVVKLGTTRRSVCRSIGSRLHLSGCCPSSRNASRLDADVNESCAWSCRRWRS
jgi:hypothetical protein